MCVYVVRNMSEIHLKLLWSVFVGKLHISKIFSLKYLQVLEFQHCKNLILKFVVLYEDLVMHLNNKQSEYQIIF